MMRLYFLLATLFFSIQLNAQLIINEVSQGANAEEYVELLVVGTPTCGSSTVDLRGWIIDDNNGWHASGAGMGIAAGHVRFANIPQWASVKIGALILIYNDAEMGAAVSALTPDVSDANADCRYIVPVSSNVLEKNTTQPSTSTTSYTTPAPTYSTTGTWTQLGMANGGDAFHTVSPANYGVPYHAIGWGSNSAQVDVYYSNAQGQRNIYMANLIDNDPYNQANYVNGNTPADETPGLPNNIANATWILSLNNNCQPVATSNIFDTVAVPLCQGDTVNINNQVINTAGSYNDTIPTTGVGCDTVRTYNVSVSPLNTRTQAVALCQGESTVINGQTVTTNGTYVDTVASSNGGCDTVVTYNVTFNPLNTRSTAVVLCPGQSVVINGQTVSTAGTYMDTVTSTTAGCDTVVTYNVSTGTTIPVAISANLCPGDFILINGQQVSTAGTYTETRPAIGGGCDTTVTYTVTTGTYLQRIDNRTACTGEVISVNGTNYTTSTSFNDTVSSPITCDTIVTYNLVFYNVFTSNNNVSICQGDSYFAGGAQQTTAGVYADTLTSQFGCDSIVNTNLTVVQPSTETITADVCIGDSYEGTVVNNDTTYTVVYTNQTGCDSTVTYNLTAVAKPVVTISDDVTIDEGDNVTLTATGGGNYMWSNGQSTADITVTPTVSTTYYVSVSNAGCSVVDSTVVTVIPAPEIDVKIPTAFSPNNDGKNDLFDVLNRFQIQVNEFRVYNRWGELVYNNPDGKWDGRYKNVEQPVGVYVYYIGVTYLKSGKQDAISGNVTLLR